jgi:hypothetical protein
MAVQDHQCGQQFNVNINVANSGNAASGWNRHLQDVNIRTGDVTSTTGGYPSIQARRQICARRSRAGHGILQ